MGSWNGTCGLSQLPIICGDDVAIFLMTKNKHNKEDFVGCVGSDNFYKPVSPPVFGVYDDYGRVANVIADKRIIDKLYGEQDSYENVDHLVNENSEEKGLYIMLVHLKLYETVVASYGNEMSFFTKRLPLNKYLRNEMLAYLEQVRKDTSVFFHELDYNSFKMNTGFEMRFYQNQKIYEENIDKDPLVDSIVNHLVFISAMSDSRKLWIPQAGQGSQGEDFEMAKLVGEFALKKQAENNEEW